MSKALTKLNSMQRQAADLSRLPLILDSIEKELKLLKENGVDKCPEVTYKCPEVTYKCPEITSTIKKLADDQIIVRS